MSIQFHRPASLLRQRLLPGAAFLTLAVAGGCGGSASTPSSPPPPQVTVSVTPTQSETPVGTIQPFAVQLSGAPSNAVKWTASAGTIDQSGNYTAPDSIPPGGTAKITATSTTNPPVSGSAITTITKGPVTLSIMPPAATLKAGFSTVYSGIVGGTSNPFVTWSVTADPGDINFPGTILAGAYTAPSPMLATDTFSISAISDADATKTASATVTVVPLENQQQQTFPIQLGASGLNANSGGDCCSGTLGSLLVDQKGRQYILSNNHVIGRWGHAAAGEDIVQPGFIDALCDFSAPKTVANFTYAPPVPGSNVDAAIAQVVPGAVNSKGQIIGLGGIAADGSYIPAAPANTTVKPSMGMPVAKSGRTTGLSCSSVLAINGYICVDVPQECGIPIQTTACFSGQVVMGNLVKAGDSGSLIVDAETAQPMGLVAGLSADGRYTTANPVSDVLTTLNSGLKTSFSFVGGPQHPVTCPGALSDAQRKLLARTAAIPQEEISHAMDVQQRHESEIMQDSAVLGFAIGESEANPGHAGFVIFIERGTAPERLPSQVEDVSVRVIETGRFTAGTRPAVSSRCAGSAR